MRTLSDIFDGEICVDMRKKPERPIWIVAAENNQKRKVVRRRSSGDARRFTGC